MGVYTEEGFGSHFLLICLLEGLVIRVLRLGYSNNQIPKQTNPPSKGEDWASFQKKQRLLQTVELYREMPVSGYFFKVLSKT
jgi:hypothetical protein